MYDILFICKHCGIHLSADENDVGISLPCPQCSTDISVPTGDVLFECSACGKTLLASADSRRRTFQCPYCNLDVVVPAQGKQIPLSSHIELNPTPKHESPRLIPPEDPSLPTTSDQTDLNKCQNDRFMETWGDYLAQAGLTDSEDKRKKEK